MMQMLPDPEDAAQEMTTQKHKSKLRKKILEAKNYESCV